LLGSGSFAEYGIGHPFKKWKLLSLVINKKDAETQPSRILLLRLSEAANKTDADRPRRAASVVERYEMPAYVARLTLLSMSVLLLLTLLWTAVCKIDVIAEAPGKLIPIGDVKPVQPASDGVIERVLVVEGEKVTKGEPLIILDRKPYEAEVKKREEALEIAKSDLEQHRHAAAMLETAVKNPTILPDQKVEIDGVSQIVESLYASSSALEQANKDQSLGRSAVIAAGSDTALLYEQLNHLTSEYQQRVSSAQDRTNELHAKKSELITQREAKQKELANAQLELKKLQSILSKSQRQERAYKAVYEEGALSMIDYLQMEKRVEEEEREMIKQNTVISTLGSQVETLKSEITQLESQTDAEIAERQAQIRQLDSQIEGIRMKLRETGRHFSLTKTSFEGALSKAKAALDKENLEIGKCTRQVSEATSELEQAQHSFEQSVLKAPSAGTVTVIKTLGPGHVVAKGQPLMTVIPSACPLVVEAKLPNKEIGFVRNGQRARIKLAAFPYQDYGVLDGTVSQIEQYPQEDQKLGSYYRVIIIPKRDWVMAGGKKIPFASGAALTAEIVVRRKTILNVILEPIRKAADIRWSG
jgi:HlyD family secretion protein